jgi:methyl-accepting chemotaxis protein
LFCIELIQFTFSFTLAFQINSDAQRARDSVDETAAAVESLQSKLNKLQRKFLKNSHDAKEVKSQAEAAKDLSSDAHEKAKKVRATNNNNNNWFIE